MRNVVRFIHRTRVPSLNFPRGCDPISSPLLIIGSLESERPDPRRKEALLRPGLRDDPREEGVRRGVRCGVRDDAVPAEYGEMNLTSIRTSGFFRARYSCQGSLASLHRRRRRRDAVRSATATRDSVPRAPCGFANSDSLPRSRREPRSCARNERATSPETPSKERNRAFASFTDLQCRNLDD